MNTRESPENIFIKHGGQLRMSEAIRLGITPYQLYSLRDRGVVEPVTRGIYRLVDLPPIWNPDLVIVSLRYPKAVICIVSALDFHQLTTQIPFKVSIAIPRSARLPSSSGYPPIRAHKFSKETYENGIEMHRIDGVQVKIYGCEKTLADCFKFRNKIGIDVVLEALKLYVARGEMNLNDLFKYAELCRVERVLRPYLEAIV